MQREVYSGHVTTLGVAVSGKNTILNTLTSTIPPPHAYAYVFVCVG